MDASPHLIEPVGVPGKANDQQDQSNAPSSKIIAVKDDLMVPVKHSSSGDLNVLGGNRSELGNKA